MKVFPGLSNDFLWLKLNFQRNKHFDSCQRIILINRLWIKQCTWAGFVGRCCCGCADVVVDVYSLHIMRHGWRDVRRRRLLCVLCWRKCVGGCREPGQVMHQFRQKGGKEHYVTTMTSYVCGGLRVPFARNLEVRHWWFCLSRACSGVCVLRCDITSSSSS